jgi:hypothetical protein
MPVDRPTEQGQRLWYLVLRVPAQGPRDLDSLVARPLMRALERDPLCEVVGITSRPGAVVVFLRSDVSESSVAVVERALAQIRLPDGSGRPEFGAAGPPGQAEQTLRQEELLGWVESGAAASDLLAWLANHPDHLGWPDQASGPAFQWALRLEAPSPADLSQRIARIPAGSPFALAPGSGTVVRLGLNRVATYLLFSGADARKDCKQAAVRSPDARCKAREAMPDGERALLGWPERSTGTP